MHNNMGGPKSRHTFWSQNYCLLNSQKNDCVIIGCFVCYFDRNLLHHTKYRRVTQECVPPRCWSSMSLVAQRNYAQEIIPRNVCAMEVQFVYHYALLRCKEFSKQKKVFAIFVWQIVPQRFRKLEKAVAWGTLSRRPKSGAFGKPCLCPAKKREGFWQKRRK